MLFIQVPECFHRTHVFTVRAPALLPFVTILVHWLSVKSWISERFCCLAGTILPHKSIAGTGGIHRLYRYAGHNGSRIVEAKHGSIFTQG
jgi:hypothetical protein